MTDRSGDFPIVDASGCIRPGRREDLDDVVRIHTRELVSRLTDLGPRIVKRFYANVLERGIGRLSVGLDEGRVAGFVFSAERVDVLFKNALLAGPADAVRFVFDSRKRALPAFLATSLRWKTEKSALDVPELVYLAVDRDRRQTGLGGRLIGAAEKYFQDLGAEFYELSVIEKNPAVVFYRKRGFTVTQRLILGSTAVLRMRRRF